MANNMRKFFLLVLITLFLFPTASYADTEEHFIYEANMVIRLEDDWLYITRDSKASDIDLSGTLFNYDGFKNSIVQLIDMLNSSAYENVHAVALGYTLEHGLIEVQVGSYKTDETVHIWDISLIPNIQEMLDNSANHFEVYESSQDKWIGSKSQSNGQTVLSYVTINNGHNVSVSVTAYNAKSEDEQIEIAHKLLNDVLFTKKNPNQFQTRSLWVRDKMSRQEYRNGSKRCGLS